MKTSLSLAALIVLCAACSTNTTPDKTTDSGVASTTTTPTPASGKQQPVDEKNGFRSYHFGDDISTFTDLVPFVSYQEPGIKKYEKAKGKENLQIGDLKLNTILYTFYQNKFSEVLVLANEKDPEGLTKLTAAATGLYGKPSYEFTTGRGSAWNGELARASVSEERINGDRSLRMHIESKTMANQKEQAEKTAGKKASADL
jgi:hypothetical protein